MSASQTFRLLDLSDMPLANLQRMWRQASASGDAAFDAGADVVPVSVQERTINVVVEMCRRGLFDREEILREFPTMGFKEAFAAMDAREKERQV